MVLSVRKIIFLKVWLFIANRHFWSQKALECETFLGEETFAKIGKMQLILVRAFVSSRFV